MKFAKTTLKNGLRIITIPAKTPAVTVMIMVEAGSNYETKEQNGLSHFLEHMCFKGTKNRPSASEIAVEFDCLGAHSNAFTSSEYTGYYAKAQSKYWKKLLEILSDIYQNPTFSETDLERERGVILQEISMYEDQPQAAVWHTLFELLYGDTPAGRPVSGSKDNVQKFKRDDFVSYRRDHYIANKTIVVVSGDIKHAAVKKEVEKLFAGIDKGRAEDKLQVTSEQKEPGLLIQDKETDQAHMVMAFRGYDARDKRTAALTVLASILGGGMSSRLWHKLRNELGACYYVSAHSEEYTDHGLFTISTGVDPKRVREVVRAILEECARLAKTPVSTEELDKAKEYLSGHLYMALETSDSLAEFYAGQAVTKKKLDTPEELEKSWRRVTPKVLQNVAKDIFTNEKLNLGLVGKVDREEVKEALSL